MQPTTWDKKAHRYGRYTPEGAQLEQTVCTLMGEMGIDFSGKRVVDIGCGTGIYTLRVAQKAAHVDALDIAYAMIKILREDARKYAIDNLHAVHSDWEAFPLPDRPYDYALSTMSPATRDAEGFAKMHRAANRKIFFGWGDKRGTVLLEALCAAHGATYSPPNGATRLRQWLEAQHYPYALREYAEEKNRVRPLAKAIEAYRWHLTVRDIVPDLQRITDVLNRYRDDQGNVVESVTNYFNLIVWS